MGQERNLPRVVPVLSAYNGAVTVEGASPMEVFNTITIPLGLVAVLGVLGCQSPMDVPAMLETIRRERAAQPADSDVAVIFSRALDESDKAQPQRRAAILSTALKQARKARRFRIADEAPLPENWPKPSLPGLVRIKTYPPVRSAWVRSRQLRNRQFMTLFRHIKDRKIAMTAPVVMEYADEASEDPARMDSTEAMAFLYRRVGQDEAGKYGDVAVADEQALQVVSVGVKGAYTKGRFRKALASLHDWLAGQDRWRQAGAPRVLGYNSPFMLFWRKYSEVQVPVSPPEDKTTGRSMPL